MKTVAAHLSIILATCPGNTWGEKNSFLLLSVLVLHMVNFLCALFKNINLFCNISFLVSFWIKFNWLGAVMWDNVMIYRVNCKLGRHIPQQTITK